MGQNVPMTTSAGSVPVRIVAAVLREGDRVLLCHRSAGRRWYPDVWDLPGGHVDEGEDPKESLVRELRDELGITAPEPSSPPMHEIRTATFDIKIDGQVVGKIAPDSYFFVDRQPGTYALKVEPPFDWTYFETDVQVTAGGTYYYAINVKPAARINEVRVRMPRTLAARGSPVVRGNPHRSLNRPQHGVERARSGRVAPRQREREPRGGSNRHEH